jgi:hypothetical protein
MCHQFLGRYLWKYECNPKQNECDKSTMCVGYRFGPEKPVCRRRSYEKRSESIKATTCLRVLLVWSTHTFGPRGRPLKHTNVSAGGGGGWLCKRAVSHRHHAKRDIKKRLAQCRATHSTSPGCSTTVDASAFVANGYIILALATELLRSIIENRSRKCVPVSSVYWYSHGVWSGANRTNSFVPQICVIKLFFLKSAVTRARADIRSLMMIVKFRHDDDVNRNTYVQASALPTMVEVLPQWHPERVWS